MKTLYRDTAKKNSRFLITTALISMILQSIVNQCAYAETPVLVYSKQTQHGGSLSELDGLTVRLGQGYNSLGGLELSQDLGFCVEKSALETFGNSPGENLSIFVRNISSSEELTSSLTKSKNFSAGFSLTEAGAKEGEKINLLNAGIQGKMKETLLRRYEAKYNYVYVQIRKNFQPEMLSSFKISDTNLTYFKARPHEFFAKCGDRFVSGLKKGAEVIGILRCESDSIQQKLTIDNLVNGSAGYKAFTSQGEVSNLLEEVKNLSKNNCKMIVAAQGGKGTYDIKDSQSFISSALNYVSSSTQDTAKPIEYLTTPYKAVLDLGFSENVLDKVDLELSKQRTFVEGKLDQINFNFEILDSLSMSGESNFGASVKAVSQIESYMSQIRECASHVYVESACKEKRSGPLLPPGTVLKPKLFTNPEN